MVPFSYRSRLELNYTEMDIILLNMCFVLRIPSTRECLACPSPFRTAYIFSFATCLFLHNMQHFVGPDMVIVQKNMIVAQLALNYMYH